MNVNFQTLRKISKGFNHVKQTNKIENSNNANHTNNIGKYIKDTDPLKFPRKSFKSKTPKSSVASTLYTAGRAVSFFLLKREARAGAHCGCFPHAMSLSFGRLNRRGSKAVHGSDMGDAWRQTDALPHMRIYAVRGWIHSIRSHRSEQRLHFITTKCFRPFMGSCCFMPCRVAVLSS